jgi:hypothetical protein
MDPALLRDLESIVGKDQVIATRERMLNYLSDETPAIMEPKVANDIVIVKPVNTNWRIWLNKLILQQTSLIKKERLIAQPLPTVIILQTPTRH